MNAMNEQTRAAVAEVRQTNCEFLTVPQVAKILKVNKNMVAIEKLTSKYDVLELKDIINDHVKYTNSEKGKEILDNFSEYLPKFKKIIPHEFKKMQMAIVQMEEKGLSSEQAQIEAFYASMSENEK